MAYTSQPVPLTLSNGVFLQTREFEVKTHLDNKHLMEQEAAHPKDATDLGLITPWISTGYMQRPSLWNLIGQGKNRLLHSEGHIFTWKTPIAEEPFYILEDITTTDKPGYGDTEFPIKLNRRFGNSAIITSNKYAGLELYVTARDITKQGDGWVHWVKLNTTNKKFKFFPKDLLRAGTKFFQIGSVMGEYSQTYDDVTGVKSGYREYYNYVGEGFANKHLSCTREAAYGKVSEKSLYTLQQYRKVIEMYMLRPGSELSDISLTGQNPVQYLMAKKGMSEVMAKDAVKSMIVKTAWIPEVEALAMASVERDVEHYAMWGAGGVLEVEGGTAVHLPIGLFHQLNMGPTYNYNIPKFNIRKLDAWITSRLKDKIDPYGTNEIIIGTGLGGLKLVRNQIKDVALASGIVFDSARYVKGDDNMMLHFDGPNFISYRMSFGVVRFEHVPELDPIQANEIENPTVDGHRLSSYLFIIDDLTANNDNIYEVVYGPDRDFHHFYINGRMNYLDIPGKGSKAGPYQASHTGPGFDVYIEKRLKCYHVIDPTKSLLIKPLNPYTGKPLFEPVF